MLIFFGRLLRTLVRVPWWTMMAAVAVGLSFLILAVALFVSLIFAFTRRRTAAGELFARHLLVLACKIFVVLSLGIALSPILLLMILVKNWSFSDREVMAHIIHFFGNNEEDMFGEIGDELMALGVAAFNPDQSTHTASVNGSVSESVKRLIQSYGQDPEQLERNMQALKNYVIGLSLANPCDIKIQAAKTAVTLLATQRIGLYIDPGSHISTKQLLGLVFAAISDAQKRTAKLEDAWNLVIEGLYEIQRGDNLNDKNIDDGESDKTICRNGAFNKLIEKLNGIHVDVEVYYITHEGALMKFPKLAQKHALQYLSRLSFSTMSSSQEYEEVQDLIQTLRTDENLESIWDNIQDAVRDELWNEFQGAYFNAKKRELFDQMIACGGEMQVSESILSYLPKIEANINWQRECSQQEAWDKFGFWSTPEPESWTLLPWDDKPCGPGLSF